MRLIDADSLIKQLEELANEQQHKHSQNPDAYSAYNEAWQDCAERAIEIVERGGMYETD